VVGGRGGARGSVCSCDVLSAGGVCVVVKAELGLPDPADGAKEGKKEEDEEEDAPACHSCVCDWRME